MDYNVNVQQAGTYNVSFRISCPYGVGSGLQLKSGSTVLATVDIPATGDWQNWQTVSSTAVLSSGQQTLRIYANQEGWALNWFEYTINGTPVPTPTPTPTPTPAPTPAPIRIEGENYSDMSGVVLGYCVEGATW